MTSKKQIFSNKQNASKSTGPKTAVGKKVASKNATTHGLGASCKSTFELSRKLYKLLILNGLTEVNSAEIRDSFNFYLHVQSAFHECFDETGWADLKEVAERDLTWMRLIHRDRLDVGVYDLDEILCEMSMIEELSKQATGEQGLSMSVKRALKLNRYFSEAGSRLKTATDSKNYKTNPI